MEYEKRDGGALFKNAKKSKDTHPDFTGNITIEGVDYRLSGWNKESKNGVKYMSLALNKKEEQKTKESIKEDTDDLPFF